MKNEYLENISQEEIREGTIKRYIRPGKYKEIRALYIPGYNWVPCAKRLVENMTTDPKELVIVYMESDDEETGSDIWVTRTTTRVIETVELW